MEQLQFILFSAEEEAARLPQAWAYRLYGWLAERLPQDTADRLHEPGAHPLTQSLWYDRDRQRNIWTLNLLDEAAGAQIGALLCNTREISLHNVCLQMEPLMRTPIEDAERLLFAGRQAPVRRAKLWFRTPCAFKQAGRYTVYPQEYLLLQSLVQHWNAAFPEYELSDPDALEAVLRGLRIISYDLHTAVYPLKGARIPGFMGSAVVDAKLALPLLELWNTLLCFADHGGVGIKTTLGMGAVHVGFLPPPGQRP